MFENCREPNDYIEDIQKITSLRGAGKTGSTKK